MRHKRTGPDGPETGKDVTTIFRSGHEEEYKNDWYHFDHGPLRPKTSFILNGYRYRSRDLDPPLLLTTYDVSRLDGFLKPQYTRLNEEQSGRERDTVANTITRPDRRLYRQISTRGEIDKPAAVIMAVSFVVKDELVDEMRRWYEEEHLSDLAAIPGWRRSRRFQLVDAENLRAGYTELLAIHDYDAVNSIGGTEHVFARARPWRKRVLELVESREHRIFDLIHEIKAADVPATTAK